MADPQPPNVVEGADVDEDAPPPAAKSAEDRKAASALASLDAASHDDGSGSRDVVDREAVDKAMKRLGSGVAGASRTAAAAAAAPAAKSSVKVNAADVALIVDQTELPRARATELLKAHEGDAVRAMRAFVSS